MSYIPSVQAEVLGAGTSYTLTTSNARIDFGTTDPEIVLPTAGTYLLNASVQFIASAIAANDIIFATFRNSTDSVTFGGGTISLGASFYGFFSFSSIVTVTASKTIQLWGANSTAARGTVESGNTSIRYVRLY